MMDNNEQPASLNTRVLAGIVALGLVLLLGLGARMTWFAPPPEAVGGPFALVDQNGGAVTNADFHGRFMLVYFGYTYCPDVCPTELQTITDALDLLDPAMTAKIAPLFITIDPERDTIDQMQQYVEAFSPALIGLTGAPEQVAQAARAYHVYYAKAKEPTPSGYSVDHSSMVYLMGPEGQFLTAYAAGTTAKVMAESLRQRVK